MGNHSRAEVRAANLRDPRPTNFTPVPTESKFDAGHAAFSGVAGEPSTVARCDEPMLPNRRAAKTMTTGARCITALNSIELPGVRAIGSRRRGLKKAAHLCRFERSEAHQGW